MITSYRINLVLTISATLLIAALIYLVTMRYEIHHPNLKNLTASQITSVYD